MGRDKPKKYNKMGYFQKQAYHDEQAKKYNINKDDFTNSTGGDRYESFDEGGYKKAIKNAMRNDFDYRTSASHMDGVKGNAEMGDFTDYERAAVKLHKKAGNGGEYSSNEDITTVTNNLVKDYRRGIQDQIDGMGDDEQTDAAITPDPKTTYSTSPETIKAKETVKAWQESDLGGDVYGTKSGSSASSNEAESTGSRPVSTNVDDFIANYKNDVYKGAKMRPNIPI